MRLAGLLALAVVLPAILAPAATSQGLDVVVGRYEIEVNGERALGWLAYPADGSPDALLVFGHGCCGKPNQSSFVASWARAYGAVVVAMDYRGPGHWDVWKGHEDLVAATEDLQARFPVERTIIWGASMGGETTGLAVAARPDLYDYWVDQFGVTDLVMEFAALGLWPAVSANPDDPSNPTRSWMIEETGGTPATHLAEYEKRSPARMADKMVGIKRAYILHGVGDLVVPYAMSREMFENLLVAGVPATLWTYVSGGGAIQGPGVPGFGVVGVPYCTNVAGEPVCAAPHCAAQPVAGTCAPQVGLAAHDGRGALHATSIVAALLQGSEPDAQHAAIEHVYDLTTREQTDVPRA